MGNVIISHGADPKPHEISAAAILAEYFNADVTILQHLNNIHRADFLIKGQVWEHKGPEGSGKRTIQNNLREADNQSSLVIIDLRRCKLHPTRAMSRINYELKKTTKIKRLLVITKARQVLDIK